MQPLETIAKELLQLREYSEQNNINKVNNCVDSFLKNPKFWILCYESIKTNHREEFFTKKAVTMNGIHLPFFYKLSINIFKGRFNFDSIYKAEIFKSIKTTDFKDKIVQKGMSVILEELSEYRFLDCSFGFHSKKSCHDAITYIKRKVFSGMWAIEGNVNKCFDQFSNKRIISLI